MISGASAERLDYNTVEDLYALMGKDAETKEVFANRIGLSLDEYGATYKDYDTYVKSIQDQINKTKDTTTKRKLEAELASAKRTRKT
jgi:hypothetical protein